MTGKRRRKRKGKGFAFKLDEKLLQEMEREHTREIIEEQRAEMMNNSGERMIRGPVFKMATMGLRNHEISFVLLTVLAAINAKSEEDVGRTSKVFLRAFLETLSAEQLRDLKP